MDREKVIRYLDNQAKYYNEYKTEQDRKYLLWSAFSYLDRKDFTIERMSSNQVLLTYNEEVVYNSDRDTMTREEFYEFVIKYALILSKEEL